MTKFVFILGTLDTKGKEVGYLRQVVRAEGGVPLIIDTGVLGEPIIDADIKREVVAQAANSSIQTIIKSGNKAEALTIMAKGTTRILQQYYKKGQLAGVLSIGGSRGTLLATQAMQSLPIGLPKLMVSTMASGNNSFGPYVGTRDVTIMHSVADIIGINAVTKPILTNAAVAVTAMARAGETMHRGDQRAFAASVLGATTPLVEQIRFLMERDHEQVIAFHATGVGGRCMEELISDCLFEGVFDVTLAEVMGLLTDGPFASEPNRLIASVRMGMPLIIAPGGLDFIIETQPERLPQRYQGRVTMRHTAAITLVRSSADELRKAAEFIANRLSESSGPVAAILPLRGFSLFSTEGEPLHNPELDMAFNEAFKQHSAGRIQIIELDTHLNDQSVAETAVQLMHDMAG